ncbi:hypothetical protein, partial [Alteribacillus bidgolensis]
EEAGEGIEEAPTGEEAGEGIEEAPFGEEAGEGIEEAPAGEEAGEEDTSDIETTVEAEQYIQIINMNPEVNITPETTFEEKDEEQ